MAKRPGQTALEIVQQYYPFVTRVEDAKKSIDLRITANACRVGKSKAFTECVIAKVLKQEFDGAIVSRAVVYTVTGTTATRYRIPSSLKHEIVSFDRNHDFRPGDYHLSAPYTSEKLGWKRGKRKRSLRSLSLKPVRRIHRTVGVRSL